MQLGESSVAGLWQITSLNIKESFHGGAHNNHGHEATIDAHALVSFANGRVAYPNERHGCSPESDALTSLDVVVGTQATKNYCGSCAYRNHPRLQHNHACYCPVSPGLPQVQDSL